MRKLGLERMRSGPPVLAAVAAATLAVSFAACGGGKPTSADGGTAAATTTGSGGSEPAAPQEVKIGFSSETQSLDPNKATYPTELAAIDLIALHLTEGDSADTPQLSLAESLEPAADQLSWTAKLRSDVTFSDGAPVTSADVQASIRRALEDRASVGAGLVAPIAAVDAPAPDTVVIKLRAPTPALATLLSSQYLSIWPKAGLAKGKAFFDAPYSGGQYALDSWGGGSTLTLRANPSHFGARRRSPDSRSRPSRIPRPGWRRSSPASWRRRPTSPPTSSDRSPSRRARRSCSTSTASRRSPRASPTR